MAGDSVMNCRCRARMTARACGRGRRAGSSLQTHVLGAKLISYRANSTGASGRYRAGTYCPRPGTSDSASSTIRHVRCRRRNTAEPHISAGSARRRRSRRLPGRQRMRRDRRRHRDNSGGGGTGSRNSDFHDSYAYCHASVPAPYAGSQHPGNAPCRETAPTAASAACGFGAGTIGNASAGGTLLMTVASDRATIAKVFIGPHHFLSGESKSLPGENGRNRILCRTRPNDHDDVILSRQSCRGETLESGATVRFAPAARAQGKARPNLKSATISVSCPSRDL
jgi:hypothetical protein